MKSIGSYRLLKRTSQVLSLLLFFRLLHLTDYSGTNEIPYIDLNPDENVFYRFIKP